MHCLLTSSALLGVMPTSAGEGGFNRESRFVIDSFNMPLSFGSRTSTTSGLMSPQG
ncbi:hypothetical protein PF005_g8381 [Phytophthora fragariae]|uniref:Uncharacterized protein n=1 Tax=Phytophthora fragariae TaxID=53985 RepID=A0A6A3FB06_9STRA|nr:hypothetical protein PF003_g21256 [Phytophthora fragariae]KAE8941561.1 hypothetical protein PF009_g8654 [Phytophthora fragariae]KAE9013219.1 hypothetical protein PF011_g8569 [Phytophthora fragariae]KAE9120656.1 hypothetical protein PF007_g8086 [Phytophthora fragariae]KAE9125387.1 hypothetical protein PF010_g5650 [Phytophthora fragariae]